MELFDFKCKYCGGEMSELDGMMSVGKCKYCGSKQTLPKLNDDKRAKLFDRANHLRRNNEFDKAEALYEQVLNDDPSDPEAYWSLVLCRFGIEYVEDTRTKERKPTVNRTQMTSVFADENYKSAIKYADGAQRELYEHEAEVINKIQKGIVEISQKEEPFDVFICYKETDEHGMRTHDSVDATELYYRLREEGIKVFFSRITLESKLGTAFEPYIFAALNSAKAMVVIGSKPEYFESAWVKNEWSRYLSLVQKSGGQKVLIPAYRDMDPYDLPKEFSHLQAQDMSKLGFVQDLVRGIKKVLDWKDQSHTDHENRDTDTVSNIAPLLRRAYMFLEDSDWESASSYFNKVLDVDPENAEAYLGLLMNEYRVSERGGLANCKRAFDQSKYFRRIQAYGSEELKNELKGYLDSVKKDLENEKLNKASNSKKPLGDTSAEADRVIRSAKDDRSQKNSGDILGAENSEKRAKLYSNLTLIFYVPSILAVILAFVHAGSWSGSDSVRAFASILILALTVIPGEVFAILYHKLSGSFISIPLLILLNTVTLNGFSAIISKRKDEKRIVPVIIIAVIISLITFVIGFIFMYAISTYYWNYYWNQ